MLLRRFESAAQVACRKGETPGFLHLYIGEEATGVGRLRASPADRLGDIDASRPRACAGQGRRSRSGSWPSSSARPTASAAGAAAPCISTTGRSGCSAPTASSAPASATRSASASARAAQGRDDIGVAFFGDGAANHGAFHEALNFAAVQRAPAVFVCENNLYATATPLSTDHAQPRDRQQGRRLRHARAWRSTATTCWRSGPAMREATERARAGDGPDADRGQDLPHRRPPRGRPGGRHLPHAGGGRRLGQARPGRHVPPAAARAISAPPAPTSSPAIEAHIEKVVRARRSTSRAPRPSPTPRRSGGTSMPSRSTRRRRCGPRRTARPAVQGWLEAVRDGIAEEMRANPTILYFGEGTGERGGSFAHTKGLWQEFGPRADGRHPDLRAGLHRRGGRRLGHRRAHGRRT